MKNNEPLFLPKGSIRGIIALITTTFVCTALFYKIALPEWFIVTWAGIIGFYFAGRMDFNNKKTEE